MEAISKMELGPEILLAIAVRADRKGLTDYYDKNLFEG